MRHSGERQIGECSGNGGSGFRMLNAPPPLNADRIPRTPPENHPHTAVINMFRLMPECQQGSSDFTPGDMIWYKIFIKFLGQVPIKDIEQYQSRRSGRRIDAGFLMKKMAIFLCFLLIPSAVMAEFSIRFENTFDQKMTYMLYWIDNPFGLKKPFNMAGGELGALESREISPFSAGRYLVTWRGDGNRANNLNLQIDADVSFVTVTPEKAIPSER
jgi:hypothetical protein